MLISASDSILATDFRYIEQGRREATNCQIHQINEGYTWLTELTANLKVSRIGYEADHLTVAIVANINQAIQNNAGSHSPYLIPTTGIVANMRSVKDDSERSNLERAIAISDEALSLVSPNIKAGITERQVAWDIEKAMRELGAESVAFDIIVAAGQNGALPHHRPDDTLIRTGDSVVVDIGATYGGYRSDLSRTFCIGPPDNRFQEIYKTVLEAQVAAEESIRPQMTGADVDSIAREKIALAGYGKYFGHGLGHGVGLEIHEWPRVAPRSNDILVDGMIFTIEPGIYIPDWGGVRIEDVVVIECGGATVLSKSPK